MSNKEIAAAFQLLAALLELHGDNPFKVRSYRNGAGALKKIDRPLAEMSREELEAIPGVGKAISTKTIELVQTGQIRRLEEQKAKTPPGIQEMLMIRGIGPKKVLTLWKELGIESPVELLYACNENRLIEATGFGLKTQQDIRQKIEYYLQSQDKHLWARVEPVAEAFEQLLRETLPGRRIAWVGEYARKCPIVNLLEVLIEGEVTADDLQLGNGFEMTAGEDHISCRFQESYTIRIYWATADHFDARQFVLTGDARFVEAVLQKADLAPPFSAEEIFARAGLPYVIPEMRESAEPFAMELPAADDIVELKDIRGILHNHSTYSDGLHSLREMAEYVRDQGYAYFGISDHSRTAVYANGLSPERVYEQFAEIDALNAELAPFRIFKGIESDILSDGSLDYEDDLLSQFDFVVASVHSVLKMDQERATRRLITAIEHPCTDILGHPTGRLLLAREGYPIDHKQVIDACAEHNVAIELNANPLRLDMDYSWIPYAMEKGVMWAINPDAHSRESIHNVRFGVLTARKGGLVTTLCLNALDRGDFGRWLANRRA
ncbi:MAG: helix-hairpin-helix domain-containing protein [Saprospiraceae bacterium]|nr:helix-hairpin-helix domain-containing protein [Saprospiraceae bacterium]